MAAPVPAAPERGYEKGAVRAADLATATARDGILYDVQDLKVYFPVQTSFFRSMVATEKKWVKAVDGVSFHVRQGEILALVGESGCGKTTTGRTLLRLEEPTGGHILYKGLPVEKFSQKTLRAYRSKAQIIFQDPYNSINPKQTDLRDRRRAARGQRAQSSEREKEERVIKAIWRPGYGPWTLPLPLPPRALGRPAPARVHRRRHRARAGHDRRRRARGQPRRRPSATTSSSSWSSRRRSSASPTSSSRTTSPWRG